MLTEVGVEPKSIFLVIFFTVQSCIVTAHLAICFPFLFPLFVAFVLTCSRQ